MAKVSTIPLKNQSIRTTINTFLGDLFTKKLIEGCLVPLEMPGKTNVVQTLVTNAKNLQQADPFAPVMPINSARILQSMTKLGPSRHKLALVMRPCEIRALVDLVKLKQANLENLILIGFDCHGAFPMNFYSEFAADKSNPGDVFLQEISTGKNAENLRWNCQVCQYPYPLYSDLTIELVNISNIPENLNIIANTENGEKVLTDLGHQMEALSGDREKKVQQWVQTRTQNRDELLETARAAAAGPEKMIEFLSTCIHCLNCMTNCPVCYCKECFFNSDTFELEAEKYFDWARQRGGIRMPNDTLFFHLTRMTHMSTSCVACGACSEACPSDIEIAKLFTVVSERTQKLFNYVAGRSLEEALPLTTFKEEELETFDR